MTLTNVEATALTWRDDTLMLLLLYRLAEMGEKIPVLTVGTEYELLDKHLDLMYTRDLIYIKDKIWWGIAKKGKETLAKMVKMYDHALKFAIFSKVDLNRQLTVDEAQEAQATDDDYTRWKKQFLIRDHMYDPRFPQKAEGTEDMRLAMMCFFAEAMKDKLPAELSPHRVVFIQKLIDGKLREKDPRFGDFQEIDKIVEAAYKWRDIAKTEAEAKDIMGVLYEAGMLEQMKRGGNECGKCRIPLGVFAFIAKEDKKSFNECPNCQTSFVKPKSTAQAYQCTACNDTVYRGQRYCSCGARIDFSLPPGTIQETTTEETTVEVWGPSSYVTYGVVPYGYYTPWDPFIDVLAFSVFLDVLW